MYEVKLVSGETVRIGRRLLGQLCMMADWQIRQCGYEPDSITAACLRTEN